SKRYFVVHVADDAALARRCRRRRRPDRHGDRPRLRRRHARREVFPADQLKDWPRGRAAGVILERSSFQQDRRALARVIGALARVDAAQLCQGPARAQAVAGEAHHVAGIGDRAQREVDRRPPVAAFVVVLVGDVAARRTGRQLRALHDQRGAVLDAFAVILGELDMTVPRLVHLGHEGLGGADRFLLPAAYPPMMLLVDLGVVAVEEGVAAFDRGVMREGIDELVSGRHRRRVGRRDRRPVGAAGFRRGGPFGLVAIVVLHVTILTLRRRSGARLLAAEAARLVYSSAVVLCDIGGAHGGARAERRRLDPPWEIGARRFPAAGLPRSPNPPPR